MLLVEVPDPLKEGLKLKIGRGNIFSTFVEVPDPLKEGLKPHDSRLPPFLSPCVEVPDPLKEGLKRFLEFR